MTTTAQTSDDAQPDSQPWSADEARSLRGTARACLSRHDCGPHPRDRMARENCGACVLNASEHPNYAGWERLFVQAGRKVHPSALAAALARTDNLPYVNALRRDLATWPQSEAKRAPCPTCGAQRGFATPAFLLLGFCLSVAALGLPALLGL